MRVVDGGLDPIEKLAPAGVFGYPAGKSIIAKKIIKLLPEHDRYVEPFCGSAAIFFAKSAVSVEALNDMDPEVIDAYKAIANLSSGDIDKLGKMDWKGSPDTFKKLLKTEASDPIAKLYRFLYLLNFSYAKHRKSFNPGTVGAVSTAVKRVAKYQGRLKNAKLFCGDYEPVVKEFDNEAAFHFLDPPYAGYRIGRIGEKTFDEAKFRKALDGIKGRFLCTYGVKGKLDTSGFYVARMRQPRTIRYARGANKDEKYLTHLLISNYKLTAKSLGGIDLEEVVGVIEMNEDGSQTFMPSATSSVSAPERSPAPPSETAKSDPLFVYPIARAPMQGHVNLRFLEKGGVDADLWFDVDGSTITWSMGVDRVGKLGDHDAVAKTFSVDGSRYFAPLTEGVPARGTNDDRATKTIEIDRPRVEMGLQTEGMHEYFLSKGNEFVGVLRIDRVAKGGAYEWRAKLSTDVPAVLAPDAPMPPAGVSALPLAIEEIVPAPMRFWEMAKDDPEAAATARAALASSGLFSRDTIKSVDGSLMLVVPHFQLAEPSSFDPAMNADAEWATKKLAEILPSGVELVEVFSPSASAIAKASKIGVALYCDAGGAIDGALQILAKSLSEQDGHYVVAAVDSPEAVAALAKLGRPFRFKSGAGVPVDAVKRLFVTSYGLRSAAIEYVTKAEWTTAYINDLPDSSFLYIEPGGEKDEEGKTKPRSLRHLPVKDKDGKPDAGHVRDALSRVSQAKIPESAKESARSAAERMLENIDKRVAKADVSYQIRQDAVLDAIRQAYPEPPNPNGYACSPFYIVDLYDDSAVFCRGYDGKLWRVEYEYEDGKVTLGGPPELVMRTYVPLASSDAAKDDMGPLGDGPGAAVPAQGGEPRRRRRKAEGGGYDVDGVLAAEIRVAKAGGEDERIVLGIVLEPDVVDAQQDTYSADEVKAACYKFMEDFQNVGLMHKGYINGKASIVENYLAPVDFEIGDQKVKKGTWLMTTHVKDDGVWKACKSGAITGFSIGGTAQRTPVSATKGLKKKDGAPAKTVNRHGIAIKIDRPKGFVQRGTDASGNAWEREYKLDYGYIPMTKGGDGDSLDVFVGPEENATQTYWVTQKKDDGSFDEYKMFVGFPSAGAAQKAYEDHIPSKYMHSMSSLHVEKMRALLGEEPKELLKALGAGMELQRKRLRGEPS